MELVFINIPSTTSTSFEVNFDRKLGYTNGREKSIPIRSVGHSWSYPTQIRGWQDWDYPEQQWGVYRDVYTFSLTPSDRIVTIVRNPFELLFNYFISDWAWCRSSHQLPTESYTKEDFQKFVDIYLDKYIPFHAPAFKQSLFSQLKDKDGNWLLNSNSVVIRHELLDDDMGIFSRMVNLPITDYSYQNDSNNLWRDDYRPDQIEKLNNLWKEDLDYFNYSFDTISQKVTKIEIRKPKIALCLSGLIRDIDYNKQFWINLIDKYDIDVYGSFWDDENTKHGDTINNLKSIFNFKELEFEKYSNFKKSTLDVISPYITPPTELLPELIDYAKKLHTLSMWYKVWKANMLSKNLNIEYDIVVRGRTDIFIDTDLDIKLNNYLNLPSGKVKTDGWENSEGVCDIFGFGKPKLMDYYSSTYLNIMEYVNQGHYMIPPENLLKVHLSRADINIRFFTNKLTITRQCKGIPNEPYDRRVELVEEITPSANINNTPSNTLKWTTSIRNNLKF